MEENVLTKFNLMKKPIPKKPSGVKVRIPVKIQALIIDKRDSGYNRNDFKARLLKGKKPSVTPSQEPEKKDEPAIPWKKKEKVGEKAKLSSVESTLAKIEKKTKIAIDEIKGKEFEISDEIIEVEDKALAVRLPEKRPSVLIRSSAYYMNNREYFINFINSHFGTYRDAILKDKSSVSCDSGEKDFSLLTHQKIVRDYINNYTPYRGLLLYHGLGSGKTCSSIAIAEGLKGSQKIVVMTPASLRRNFMVELKKCGDSLYRYNQFWEFLKIKAKSPLESAISRALSLSVEFMRKQGGAWFVDIRKKSNYSELSTVDKFNLDRQIDQMIQKKYQFINYNGLNKKIWRRLTQNNPKKNPFSNKVVIIDEAHNFVSRIVNKMGRKESLSLTLYEKIKSAQKSRIIFLTGTPIINYPNELGIMFNMLRGKIKTFNFLLDIKSSKKIDQNFFQRLFQEQNMKIIDFIQYNPSTKKLLITRNPFGFVNSPGKYSGVSVDQQGNITDKAFVTEIGKILQQTQITISKISVDYFDALPDKLDSFKTRFIDNDGIMKNENLFKRRILGLTSYYRSASEQLLPSYNPNDDFIIEKCPMSLYQLGVYEEARQSERDQAKKSAKRKKMQRGAAAGIYKDTGSTYRIFSRLFCNFVFPKEITRPLPMKSGDVGDTIESNINEDLLDDASVKDKITNPDGHYEADQLEEIQQEEQEKTDGSYSTRISRALAALRKNAGTFLSRAGLKTYSPKFLKMLENILNINNVGLHLIYSQFRTLEGIGILKLILEENGFFEFKIQKNGAGGWEVTYPENIGKPSFVLYTGTESSEEKEIVRNIFNNEWKKVPKTIVEQITEKSPTNYYGEIIKIFMITAAGAEGISLQNVRHVHITEPYWHPVRTEQVIGRARRICSHHNLPEEERNVKVYMYLMTFSEKLKKDKLSIELKLHDVSKIDKKTPFTSDEALYEISTIKETINKQLLKAIKESSMDCLLYAKVGGKEKLTCFAIGGADQEKFAYNPSISDTESDKTAKLNQKIIKWKARPLKFKGTQYAYRVNKTDPANIKHEIYDYQSFKIGKPLLLGHITFKGKRMSGIKFL